MAKLTGGIFGNFQGRIGNTVYYMRKGKQVVRRIGRIEKPATHAQLSCRQSLTVLNVFFKSAKTFINTGFATLAERSDGSAYNVAIKYNMAAMKGEYPDVSLEYSKLLLSKGNLLAAVDLSVARELDGLRFSWDVNGIDYENRYDVAMILVYFPGAKETVCLLNAGHRSAGTVLFELDEGRLQWEEAHCYLAFISEDRAEVSESRYVELA